MACVGRAATLGCTIGISLIGTIKNVSIANQHNYLLIFGRYLNCRYQGEVKNLCLYKICEKNDHLLVWGF